MCDWQTRWQVGALRAAKSPHGPCRDAVERGAMQGATLREFRVGGEEPGMSLWKNRSKDSGQA